jgi:hypothetical protein
MGSGILFHPQKEDEQHAPVQHETQERPASHPFMIPGSPFSALIGASSSTRKEMSAILE